MKIVCIGRNYAAHAKELNSPVPDEPVFFMKPESAILSKHNPFFLPDFSEEIHHEIELVLKICKLGKNIEEAFAHKYYDKIGIGIDFTARDLQEQLKKKGLPWEKSKSFDGSAPLGEFLPKSQFEDLNNINFRLDINGDTVQVGNTADLLFSFDNLIAYVSRFVTLKIGDLIFTGTPAGVGPVKANDRLEGYISDELLLTVDIK